MLLGCPIVAYPSGERGGGWCMMHWICTVVYGWVADHIGVRPHNAHGLRPPSVSPGQSPAFNDNPILEVTDLLVKAPFENAASSSNVRAPAHLTVHVHAHRQKQC